MFNKLFVLVASKVTQAQWENQKVVVDSNWYLSNLSEISIFFNIMFVWSMFCLNQSLNWSDQKNSRVNVGYCFKFNTERIRTQFWYEINMCPLKQLPVLNYITINILIPINLLISISKIMYFFVSLIWRSVYYICMTYKGYCVKMKFKFTILLNTFKIRNLTSICDVNDTIVFCSY